MLSDVDMFHSVTISIRAFVVGIAHLFTSFYVSESYSNNVIVSVCGGDLIQVVILSIAVVEHVHYWYKSIFPTSRYDHLISMLQQGVFVVFIFTFIPIVPVDQIWGSNLP